MKLSKKNLIKCSQACVNSYVGRHGDVVDLGLKKLKDFNINHVEGFTGIQDKVLFIVFRGSDGTADWVDNFKFWKRKTPYDGTNKKIKVHAGFIDQYMDVRKLIFERVKESNCNSIIIIGHSLGASLATHCALDLQYNRSYLKISCFTEGSPRVGNRHFVKSYNKRVPDTYRFVYKNDTVAKVPYAFMGYKHVNKKIYLGKKLTWIEKLMFNGNPLDHYPEKYLSTIKRK